MIMDFQMALCHTKSIIFQHCYGFFKWNYIRMVACTPSLYSTVFIMIELLPVTLRLKKKKSVYRRSVVIHVAKPISWEPSEECEV